MPHTYMQMWLVHCQTGISLHFQCSSWATGIYWIGKFFRTKTGPGIRNICNVLQIQSTPNFNPGVLRKLLECIKKDFRLAQWRVLLHSYFVIQGLSCKIGNIPVPGTSENQNCQFYEIHHFSLIFTFLYYIVTLKHIRQSYCSDNQHVVAYQWKSMSQGQTEKCTACLARKKYFFCKDKV